MFLANVFMSPLIWLLGITLVLSTLGYWGMILQSRAHQKNTQERIYNPLVDLSKQGIDLLELFDVFDLNLRSIAERIGSIQSHLNAFNQEMQGMYSELEGMYKVVTKLAQEEVLFLDAVRSTSQEIYTMLEIISAVIDEINLRNDTMQEMVHQSANGKVKVARTTEALSQLSNSAEGMLKLIDFINSVTKKTNLLAINAAIESTHTGESGKGFAVIAEEMRNLAILTAQNAKEVTKLLSGSVEWTGEAYHVSQDSGNAFEIIHGGVQTIHGTIAEVAQTISELRSRGLVVQEKTKVMDSISKTVKDISGEVYGLVVQVNAHMDEVKQSGVEIENKVKELSENHSWLLRLSKKVMQKMDALFEETDKKL